MLCQKCFWIEKLRRELEIIDIFVYCILAKSSVNVYMEKNVVVPCQWDSLLVFYFPLNS